MYRGITLLGLTVLLIGMVSLLPQGGVTLTRAQEGATIIQDEMLPTKDAKKAGKGHPKDEGPVVSASGFCQGTGTFTNHTYNCAGESYSYNVTGGPPNSCGELHIRRNGGPDEVTPCWLITDGNGSATKGSWTVQTDETDTNIYIKWPDGSQTCGGDTRKVNDATTPTIQIDPLPRDPVSGVPTAFTGAGFDRAFGSGFDSWTNVEVTFADITNPLSPVYWNGSCYCSYPTAVKFYGTFSPSSGFSVNWSISPLPPPGAHESRHTYQWCARIKDKCRYSDRSCYAFTAR